MYEFHPNSGSSWFSLVSYDKHWYSAPPFLLIPALSVPLPKPIAVESERMYITHLLF
jgi:hypothetical protein